ncbi:hypothetical protein L2E82_42654 [Cichorium intybus]|uniref:Uncharacterized protein n=1 Tax=Cichorium intybus TaxID=13427 RepID=A0ACB8ZRR9_CICIN|nr:hypothetical protein L2E82_42654 [Cichorium intybus]
MLFKWSGFLCLNRYNEAIILLKIVVKRECGIEASNAHEKEECKELKWMSIRESYHKGREFVMKQCIRPYVEYVNRNVNPNCFLEFIIK